ncbi:MAG: hypothetical protein V4656_17215 [Pseudomonadota bacterium]
MSERAFQVEPPAVGWDTSIAGDRARLDGLLRALNDVCGYERTKALVLAELTRLEEELVRGGPRA